MPLSAAFSALEAVPLTLITLAASDFVEADFSGSLVAPSALPPADEPARRTRRRQAPSTDISSQFFAEYCGPVSAPEEERPETSAVSRMHRWQSLPAAISVRCARRLLPSDRGQSLQSGRLAQIS
jgi:hypothetical protein